jgi:HMG (high mobility group) box
VYFPQLLLVIVGVAVSAYNLFFRDERKKWLEERDQVAAVEEDHKSSIAALEQKKTASATTPKKRAKSLLFETMAKTLGKRWKELPASGRKKYVDLAEVEMKRYRREMELYHDKLVKETTIGSTYLGHQKKKARNDRSTTTTTASDPTHRCGGAVEAVGSPRSLKGDGGLLGTSVHSSGLLPLPYASLNSTDISAAARRNAASLLTNLSGLSSLDPSISYQTAAVMDDNEALTALAFRRQLLMQQQQQQRLLLSEPPPSTQEISVEQLLLRSLTQPSGGGIMNPLLHQQQQLQLPLHLRLGVAAAREQEQMLANPAAALSDHDIQRLLLLRQQQQASPLTAYLTQRLDEGELHNDNTSNGAYQLLLIQQERQRLLQLEQQLQQRQQTVSVGGGGTSNGSCSFQIPSSDALVRHALAAQQHQQQQQHLSPQQMELLAYLAQQDRRRREGSNENKK